MELEQIDRLRAALADRYSLDRELGSGGMATVYLADDLKHRRKVAVKVIRPELAAALGGDRFLREIEVAARLSHPHIVALFDSGDADGVLYYVMPYVRGESVRQKLDREGQLPVEEAVRIARQVASALAHAHSQGLVHRDVKPENILLHEGEAVVTDFGIATGLGAAAGERLTGTGIVVGTPEYMSPEQGLGEGRLDARSDVYGLGCVLFEMLAGEPPYRGSTALALIMRHATEPVPSVRRLRDSVPPHVDRAISKALAKVPADRFDSARAFAEALAGPGPGGRAVPAAGPGSVAVLPFLSLSSDPDNEYFADGITEDVIAQLSKIRALDVISRTSVMPFKKREKGLREIAAQLGVTALVEGSVRRAGDRVRIVAQLIDASTDQHLWAETYDRDLTDIFAIQSEVALQIAAALRAELSPDERVRIRKEPTEDFQAYQFYLKGRQCVVHYTPEWMQRALDYFRRAIDCDPGFALAHAAQSFAYAELGGIGALPPDEAHDGARRAAERALELDPELGEAHTMLAYVRFVADFDWEGADREFRRALELNPGSADTCNLYGRMCASMGRHDESVELQRRATALDPLAHRGSDLANALLRAGRCDEALAEAKRTVEFDDLYDRAHATLGWAYLKSGMTEEGLRELERAVELSPHSSMWLAQLGQAYALAGREADARNVLERLERIARESYVPSYYRAYVHAGLGEADRALDFLERAMEEREAAIYGLKGSFLFTMLHPHPRFRALLARMNLA
jgi:serine/threonine protein kinase/tetratricopeptide (TPR) repeat protein